MLIVGAEGFIGSFLSDKFSSTYNIYKITKGSIDVLDVDCVYKFLKENNFDIILNCLTFGGKQQVNVVDHKILKDNLTLFNNFLLNSDKFSHFINIGSGSEFDTSSNINNALEIDIFNSTPKQSYSFSKNLIARSIFYNNKFTTLRLFGCFGSHEPDIRLLKKYIVNGSVDIVDRFFDFISIQDFSAILQYVLGERITSFDVNCVYDEKIKLSLFLSKYDQALNKKSTFNISGVSDLNYTGDSTKLSSLQLNLLGLEGSFKKHYG